MRTLRGLLLACHLGPTVAVTALVTALAWSAGRSPAGCLLVAATILTGHLSIGWSNDAIDAARDTIVNRKDKPVVRGLVSRRTLAVAAGVMLVVTIPVSLANGLAAGLVHLLFIACAWAYNLGLKSTVISWLPYAVAFGALPSFVTLGTTDTWAPWWATTAGALLGVGAHLANVAPDLQDDLATGVRGWPQRLGSNARLLVPIPLAASAALLTIPPPGPIGVVGWIALVVVAGLLVVVVAWRQAPFLLTLGIAAVSVVSLILSGTAL
ncbi:UbiA family prenyltransferase [Kribbella sandramycini]|uniref:4-hydroxybenzoate polyprenyltransferase n=1 Tax=Kribbella sandramycini TaxID=60450 RepID=A0A841SFR7_9ACTN|nr:4-hydroxybenzoate polyprenyltransferase [Kribbella sandramycini]